LKITTRFNLIEKYFGITLGLLWLLWLLWDYFSSSLLQFGAKPNNPNFLKYRLADKIFFDRQALI
jgi:hypothetical protein